MILRKLSPSEIRLLSCRYRVNQKVVEDFLERVGGISIETAYKNLNHERKIHRWKLPTINAILDGITLGTTRLEQRRDEKNKAGAR